MIALKGIYKNGKVSLSQSVKSSNNTDVIVTFLDEDITTEKENIPNTLKVEDFSFLQAIEATKNINVSFCDTLIEERRLEA